MALGVVWCIFYLPETKGRTLEEMAVVFGDDEDVVVLLKDIHVDHHTHTVGAVRERRREVGDEARKGEGHETVGRKGAVV